MARNYAKILVTIWSNEDFKALPRDLQHMYFVLLSQARLSTCGLLDFFPTRLATCCDEMTIDDVATDLKGLERRRYIVVDYDTQELLIRSFMRNDGVLHSPNLTVAAVREYGEVMSEKVRKAIETELSRAYREAPSLPSWKKVREENHLLAETVLGKGSE